MSRDKQHVDGEIDCICGAVTEQRVVGHDTPAPSSPQPTKVKEPSNYKHAAYTIRESEPGKWVAHALQYDVVSVRNTRELAISCLRKSLTVYIAANYRISGLPFFPAPPSYWQTCIEYMELPTAKEIGKVKFKKPPKSKKLRLNREDDPEVARG